MPKPDILEEIFDKKVLSILRIFYREDKKEFYLREIANTSKVPLATTFRIINKLVQLNIIEQIQHAKFKIYRLADNENTRFLGPMVKKEKQVLEVFTTKAKNIRGLETIYLQGKEEKDRANLIIIGEGINADEVKRICGEIREQYNYMITPLILTKEQFEQMDKMGLYPGKKKILYRK